ncbi:unnamed protein product, partial [Prorocentrum cordatum]
VAQLPLGPSGDCSGRWRVPAAPHPASWVSTLGARSPALELVALGSVLFLIWPDGFATYSRVGCGRFSVFYAVEHQWNR